MAFSWVFAGGKAQGLGVLDAARAAGFVPRRIAVPKGLGDDDRLRVEAWARAANVALIAPGALAPEHLRDVDLLLVCRFEILRAPVFTAPRWGTLNVHSALLPAYRGVHPVSWALVDGAAETGVTVHGIDAGVDTGPIVAQRRVTIRDDHDLHSLTADIDAASAALVAELFVGMDAEQRIPAGMPQRGVSSYARRRTPEDGRVDWTRSARDVFNLTRALPAPLPPAFTDDQEGRRYEVRAARPVPVERPAPAGTVVANVGAETIVMCGQGAVAVLFGAARPAIGTTLGVARRRVA